MSEEEQKKALIENLSYSSITSLRDCGWYFKKRYVDKVYLDEDTWDTHFGDLAHDTIQDCLQAALPPHIALPNALAKLNFLVAEYPLLLEKSKLTFSSSWRILENIIENYKEVFAAELPYEAVVKVEDKLDVPILETQEQKSKLPLYQETVFKGYVDIVFKTNDQKYILADFKTCGSAFFFKKNLDKIKEYQLTLYKYFYSKKYNIPLDDIETYFILLEKVPTSKKPIEFLRITSGNVKVSNALQWLQESLEKVARNKFMKNRTHCRAFGRVCSYYDTEHCTR